MQGKGFSGFMTKGNFTPLPDLFFTHVLPQIQDVAEIKVTIYVFYLLGHKQGYPRFVTYRELLSHSALMAGMEEETLHYALNLAAKRGTILHLTLNIDGRWEECYFTNTESARKAIDEIKRSGVPFREAMTREEDLAHGAPPLNIFTLYEQNVGVITPMIAEELKEAAKLYPAQWIEEAFKEAVMLNKRSWRYIARILERWTNEGKDSGEDRQGVKKADPDKYIKGKYGHLVKR